MTGAFRRCKSLMFNSNKTSKGEVCSCSNGTSQGEVLMAYRVWKLVIEVQAQTSAGLKAPAAGHIAQSVSACSSTHHHYHHKHASRSHHMHARVFHHMHTKVCDHMHVCMFHHKHAKHVSVHACKSVPRQACNPISTAKCVLPDACTLIESRAFCAPDTNRLSPTHIDCMVCLTKGMQACIITCMQSLALSSWQSILHILSRVQPSLTFQAVRL